MRPEVRRDYEAMRKHEEAAVAILCKLGISPPKWSIVTGSADRFGFDMIAKITAGVRIRREAYRRYEDFTIRLSRPSGAMTEYEKIMRGRQHVMIYGFEPDINEKVVVLDFRTVERRTLLAGVVKAYGRRLNNGDGSSTFYTVPVSRARQAGLVRYERGYAA